MPKDVFDDIFVRVFEINVSEITEKKNVSGIRGVVGYTFA